MGEERSIFEALKDGASVAIFMMVLLLPLPKDVYLLGVLVASAVFFKYDGRTWKLGEYTFVYMVATPVSTVLLAGLFASTGQEMTVVARTSIWPGHAIAFLIVYWRNVRLFSKPGDPSIFKRPVSQSSR